MPSRRSSAPTYRRHAKSDSARCWVNGKWVQLGKYDSPESHAEFARIVAEHAAQKVGGASGPNPATSIDEILLAYLKNAGVYYRTADGKPTNEVAEIKRSIVPLRKLYGHTPAAEFGPRALAAVRNVMVSAGWCRTLINRRMDRVKRAFKWATSEELIPVAVYHALRTLPGLKKGRSEARESEPVKPVEPEHVTALLPHLSAQVRAMVELQRYTGMRPGEACALTLAEVDRSADLSVYRPGQHKTAHRGGRREIVLGPKARAALVAFLLRSGRPPEGFEHVELNNPDHRDARRVMADAYQDVGRDRDAELLRDVGRPVVLVAGCVVDPQAPLFRPADSRAEWAKAARSKRKSKVPPSQTNRRKADPEKQPGAVYGVAAYGFAVRKAADKAGVPHWHPNQLRHTFATEVRRAYGVEAAQVLLGHARVDVTQVYAERDFALAARVAAEIG